MSISRPRQSGLSLIELVMFIVIIGIAVVAVINVMNVTSKLSTDPVRQKQALAIAESLLEEVQMARMTFCDPTDTQAENATSAAVGVDGVGCTSNALIENAGQEVGGVGRPFDNVNDYAPAGYGVASAAPFQTGGVLTDVNGNALASGYSANVTITPTDTLGGIASDAAPLTTNVLRITVTVSYGADRVVLDGYRTRYAPNSMP